MVRRNAPSEVLDSEPLRLAAWGNGELVAVRDNVHCECIKFRHRPTHRVGERRARIPEQCCEKQAQEGRSPAAEHVSPVWIVTDDPRSSTTAVRLEKRQRCRINRDSHSYLPPSGQKTDLSRGAGLWQQTAALIGRPGSHA